MLPKDERKGIGEGRRGEEWWKGGGKRRGKGGRKGGKGRGRRRGDETSRRKEGAVGIIIILVIACSAGWGEVATLQPGNLSHAGENVSRVETFLASGEIVTPDFPSPFYCRGLARFESFCRLKRVVLFFFFFFNLSLVPRFFFSSSSSFYKDCFLFRSYLVYV